MTDKPRETVRRPRVPLPPCLPLPDHPDEPGPGPDDAVDWMSYPHQRLYDMVNDGVDLAGATSVGAAWASLGESVADLGMKLQKALDSSADGWEGDAANTARDATARLVDWTETTSESALRVSGCVVRQADIAETARRTMPDPPIIVDTLPEPWTNLPVPKADLSGGGTSPSGASAPVAPMTRTDFAQSAELIVDPGPDRSRALELHRRAADVMEQMQRSSTEVYQDVPRFSSPLSRSRTNDPSPPQPYPPLPDPKRPTDPPADDTTDSSSTDGGPAPGPAPRDGTPGPATGLAPAVQAEGPQARDMAGGSRVGAVPPTASAANVGMPNVAAQPPPAPGAAPRAGGMGMAGMPMSGMGGAGQQADIERKLPSYLEDDSDFWSSGEAVVPPVLGEDPPSGRGY